MTSRLPLVCVCFAGALAACWSANENNLRTRAVFDPNCPQDQLQVRELGGYNRGVTGCGHRATYSIAPGTGDWVLNGTDAPAGAASAPNPH